jgi:hypothetical protein
VEGVPPSNEHSASVMPFTHVVLPPSTEYVHDPDVEPVAPFCRAEITCCRTVCAHSGWGVALRMFPNRVETMSFHWTISCAFVIVAIGVYLL